MIAEDENIPGIAEHENIPGILPKSFHSYYTFHKEDLEKMKSNFLHRRSPLQRHPSTETPQWGSAQKIMYSQQKESSRVRIAAAVEESPLRKE